ncbi:GTP-binding protein [Brucella endophytica]|uniref:GTP-binding protein n=1 Tax=Brucella endophytica TaxID=1963359 RepID=A0A916SRN8_9HYPH|nr:AAA family ATPase [Brucella endophytica]GGB13231.1 GTP-binding protein [Brucella endophytica]
MKISALRLHNVKRFAGRGVAIEGIGDGVNVLCAANEFGKSTSFEALHALFFQPHSSVSGDVRNLRPYSGGNPLVEADISTDKGRFRITKQYYGGRSARVTDLGTGRLLAQADEAENFIADLIKGGTPVPAGLLWVRQGVTGIEPRKKSEEDGEREVRRNLLESVQGEVEAVTGGRRMAEIMDAARGALAELVTDTGRPRTGGRYAAEIGERDRLAAEEQRLSGEVAALREALQKRAAAKARLAELSRPEDRDERRKAIEAAQAAFDAARAHSEKLKTAETELTLARERRAAAEKELGAFQAALEKAKELDTQWRQAVERRSEIESRQRDAIPSIDKARAEDEAAEARAQETGKLVARMNAASKAREAWGKLAELKDRLGRAEAIRQAIEEGEARLALEKIPPNALDELQALEIEIAKLRAAEEAARPSVAIRYEAGATAAVTMNGTPLDDGEHRGFDEHAELAVPGIGTITLHSNRPASTGTRLEKAEAARLKLLGWMGIKTLAEGRERQARAQRMESDLKALRGQLSLLAPKGLAELREEVAAREAAGAESLELKWDPAQIEAAYAEAEEQRKAARLALRELEPMRESLNSAFIAAEAALTSVKLEMERIGAMLGPEAERGERERSLSETFNAADRALATAEAHAATLRAAAVDLQSAEATLKRALSVHEAAEKEINTLRETIASLSGEIATRSDEAVEEKWRETSEALSAAKSRVEMFEKEVAVLRRLSSALESARAKARELYLKPVMAELRPLLGLLFDDVSLTFDEKTLLPQKIERNGQEEDVDRLSGGMREQLSVLTRLAFAKLLARDGRPAPVILDDALVYSDDDRIEKMFDALHRQSRDQQIIVFSCRQRAFQKLGGNILEMTDWQP